MSDFETFFNRQNKPVKVLLWLLMVPFFLVMALPAFILMVVFGLYAYLTLVLGAVWLKISMAWNKRGLSSRMLTTRLKTGAERGTLIVDSYTLGWGVNRIWWTPDAIPTRESDDTLRDQEEEFEEETKPFQQGIYDTYVDLQKGKALLLRAWMPKNALPKIQKKFPGIPHFQLWSGAIEAKRRFEARKQALP